MCNAQKPWRGGDCRRPRISIPPRPCFWMWTARCWRSPRAPISFACPAVCRPCSPRSRPRRAGRWPSSAAAPCASSTGSCRPGGEPRRGCTGSSGGGPTAASSAATTPRRRPRSRLCARRWRGLFLEDKGGTIALHYRDLPQAEAEIRAVAEALCRRADPALRLIAGKMVVEFQPRRASKATAIAAFMAEPPFRGRRPVFLGDDTTDEDGFAEVNRRGGVSVHVGPAAATAARYGLASVAAALDWLESGLRGGPASGND